MTEINGNEIENYTKHGKVVIVWSAPWCGPCTPHKKNVEQAFENTSVKCYQVSADKHADVAIKYGVQQLPTTMFFKDGELIDGFTGSKPTEKIRGMVV